LFVCCFKHEFRRFFKSFYFSSKRIKIFERLDIQQDKNTEEEFFAVFLLWPNVSRSTRFTEDSVLIHSRLFSTSVFVNLVLVSTHSGLHTQTETRFVVLARATLHTTAFFPQLRKLISSTRKWMQGRCKKKKKEKRQEGREKRVCNLTSPHEHCHTHLHSSPPISGKRVLNIAAITHSNQIARLMRWRA